MAVLWCSRESAEGGRVIVEVDDKVATVRNIKADSRLDGTWDSREKTVAFSFDYCYWSVDPEDPKYASQEMVFQDLGTSVLSGAFRGYNICLFAYGQTGSGKTYTMMGTPASIGLTPRICEGLFSRKDDYSDQTASCRVKVSFLEIYNERVRDLLKQSDHKKPYTLRVREHPETGPYVQGLSQHLVTDYKQVVELLEEGIAKRITAATHIHNASSRSHAIFTIHYTQAILENNLPSEIASKINLVDLAGSERADPSYCKDRITEGANINKSLVTLGIVISTLAQNSQMFSSCQSINTLTSEGESSHVDSPSTGSVSGTRRPAYIPYRDSILTWLLKDSLGGNSKTIMIATISPASSSYNETMSTLRYASNAKNIINKPRVNEDANVRLIRELREEIDRLKTMLISFELRNSSPSWSDDRDGNLTELVLQNEMKIEQLTKDWTSKWMDRKAIMKEYSVDINKEKAGVTIDSSLPHLMAMDDDILSTGVVLYHLREGTTKIGRSDSDQDQDIVLQGRWIEKDHCVIDNICGIVTLRPVQGAHCTVNGCEVTGSCRLSQGALVVLGKSHKFRFNHPAEAAVLRQRRSINDIPPILSCRALDWLNLDGSCTHSPHYILSSLENQKCRNCKENKWSPEISREIDAVHEEYQQKLRDQEAFHRKQIQRQQLYVEDLKQQILRGQIKAEQELENDQALINQQIQENQQWLINENNRLAALQQQQREFAVQTESTLYAEAEVQSSIGQEICPSLLQQNKKTLVQLELLRRYSLKKAERNIRRKKVKFQLERIVKKQKLLEAKQNLEQLEASCWLSEVCVKQPRVLNQNIAVQASRDHPLQKRRRSLGSSSLQHRQHSFCNFHLPRVPSCLLKGETISKLSTSPNTDQCCEGNTSEKLSSVEHPFRKVKDVSRDDDLNDEKGTSFLVQKQLTEKQKASSFRSKKGAERDSNDSAIMAHINKNDQKMEKLNDSTGQAGCQNQTSKGSSPDHFKEKDEPQTFITVTRMTKAKVPGDLSQPANSYLEQNRAQVSNKKTRMDINGKGHNSPENFAKEMKKDVVYGNLPSAHLNQTAKNLKREPTSALRNHEKSSVEQQEFLMVATSVGNLTKINTQTPLSYAEKKWHSAELLSAGVSKTATDMLGNWQEDDENEISDTDSSYSVDSLSCAYAKAFAEKLKQEDFSRNKCFANPEDSESDDSQMSQDSLVEKENKVKMRNKSQFHKLKAPHQPARLYKSRTEHHLSSLVTSYASHRRLGRAERSFSLDSLGDGEEVPAEDPVEESKSDSSDEVPAEIFWKLQTPTSPTIQTEEDCESRNCDRDTEGTRYNLKLSSSFYLDTKSQPASSNACKQFLKEATVSFVQQERSIDRQLYYGLPVAAQSSCDSKVEIGSPRITVPSSHGNLEFQNAHLYSLSKPEGWLKKDDLKQSAAEFSFVSGSKQIHSITHLSHSINELNSSFSSDTSEIPLPETTAASRVSENGSLNRITEEWTNANENSPLESQDITSSFVSSVGPSSSFVCISAKPDYYEHSTSNHPEQEQLNELSSYRSTTECTQTFGCLESTSTADCLSLVPGKEEDSLPTTHPELPKDHNLEKAPFISVLPVHVLEQRNGCVDSDLEDDFFRTIEKDDLDDDYNNLTESKITDLNTGSASVNSPAAESSTGLTYNMASTQSSAVEQVQFGNHVQLFPRREIPTCCDEGFFLSNLTNQNCSLGSVYELQVLARQGAESAVTLGLRSGESNLETMQDTDYEQIPAEEITIDTDFSSKKVTYKCNPLVLAYSASYDQSATPVELSQKEKICMETSMDSLAEIVSEAPSFRDDEEYEPKDPELSSSNHYEFKSKPVSKNYSPECVLADGPVGCLSQHISENSTLCTDNIRAESSESDSQVVVQKDFLPKYKNLMVNEASYLTVNVNGKDTESFPAAVCESTNNLLPESNSSVFYQASPKVNLFQSASETESCDKLLEHATIVKGDGDATPNHTMEVGTTKSCSDIDSNDLCTTCSSKSPGEKNSMYKLTDISVEFDATIQLETKTKNKSSLESRVEKEACFESDCPEDILLVEDHVNSEFGVFEYNTNKLATVSQEESLYINKEYKFLRKTKTDPEEAMFPYQNAKANTDEEETKLMNSAVNLEKNMLEIKSGQVESLPDYPVPKAQSVTADRSAENKPIDIVASEVQCEVYTNLCLTHEEAEKDESQVGSTDVEHTQESKAFMCSDSCLKTNSFCPKKKSEKIEIAIYSPELSVSPQNAPSAVCSHTTDVTQDTLGFLDACEGLLQINRTTENVFDMEDVAATVLITGRQGNSLEKNEKQVESSNLPEHFIPNCLPHANFDQENKVSGCEVTESEEQIIMTNTEGPTMKHKVICADKNVLFPEESSALHQMNCDRDDEEEILNQYEIPERYLTASGLEDNVPSVDDSQYCDPTEMREDGGSADPATDARNTVMTDTDVYECSVDDNINIDKYTIGQESKRLRFKEDSHTYMSCSVQYPEHGTSEKLNESIIIKREICGLDSIGSRLGDEKVHLMNLEQMDKTDRERQMFLENTEEVELIILQNLSELFPENKDGCHDDSRLDEILRESQWVSTSFSGSNEDTSKQQNPPATLKSTENIHEDSDKDSLCQSVNQLFYLGVIDNSHVVPDDPTTLEGHTKPSNSCAGTGAVLPYYETLVENEVCVSTPGKTVNKEGADASLSDKIQSRNEAFPQNKTALDRQEEEPVVCNNIPNSAPGQPVSENSSSVLYCVGGDESETVALKQGAEENPFSVEKIDSSEDKIQDNSNSNEEPSVDLMVNNISKDCFNSIEERFQEEKDTIMPDSLHLDNSNLLSFSEKEVMEDVGEKAKHSTQEISSQKIFHSINMTEKELHSGSPSQHDDKEKCLNTSCSITSSKNDNAGFPGISGYQHEPRENQGHRTSEKCCVDCPESAISENISTLSESLKNSLWENPHSNKELLNYKSSPGLMHSPVSFAEFLIDSNGDKCKNDAVLSEETKYFERESTDLSVSVTFPDVPQKGDERNNSAVTEATDAQNKKLPDEAVGTDQNGKIIQGSFQNCNDTKENKMHEYLEHYSNTSSMTVPESGMLAVQSLREIGSKESKCLPAYFAEDAPTDKLFQSCKNFSAFNTCLLDDSKSLIFSHLEDSLQDPILTEQVSSGSADVQSVKEDLPQTCAEVNYPSLTAFSESSSAADIDHGVTGTCGISHTSILKHPPFAVLQMQDTQSDKSVVFDEPVHASGSILLSLAKENRHYPVSDTDPTLYENSTVDVEPVYGSNCQQFDNDIKVDQHHWGKVLAQKACTEHTNKVSDDADSLSLPSLPLWDTGRSILVEEGQMRKILNRNEEQLHSSTEAKQSVVEKKQRKTVNREAEKQTAVSSDSTSELIDPQDVTDTDFPGDVNVDPEHTCDSFGPAKSRSSDPRQLYHTVLGFEKSPADLQGNCHYVPTGGANPGQTNTDARKWIVLCKNNAGSSIDADADSCSTTGGDTMKNETLKSERLKFYLMNNETNSLKFLTEDHDLPTQESKLVQFRSKRSWSAIQNTNSCTRSEQRPYLQSHRLSAPAIAVFSDLDYTSEASSKVDPLLYSASKSLQDLNMSVEPPSPTEDDLHGVERFSKQESKNFLQVKSKPRFQQRMTQTKKLANCDLKNVHYAARTQSSQSSKDRTVHSPSLLHTAHSAVGAEENTHSKSSSVAQCSEGRAEEAGYQPGTDKFSQDNKDAMHFNSSDINPYIHPWQQDELCKIGWKQYVFGSASDVSCNQMPLNLDSRKVTRCSSVDNGLNSQNSPFHSHLSSYATAKVLSSTLSSIEGLQGWDVRQGFESAYSSDNTKQYSNVSIETPKTNTENNTAEFENPSVQPGNSAMQVDEIVLLYPSESERSSKKSPGITCEQGTQTVATARYKRQRRHQRSYTDISARKQETNRDLLQQHSSWTSMQNLSMHLSQLIQNTSELLGNLSQQNIIDNEQNAKISQRKTEEGAKAARSDSCTQTTADIGTQTETLEEPRSKHEEKQVQVKMENELRAAQTADCDLEGVVADVGKIPKRKEETLTLEERAQEQTEMRNLNNPDFHDSLDSILEDSFMRLPFLPRASTPTLDFQKTSLNTQQNAAFASTRVSSVTSSSLSSGKDDSSCTVVSSPTNSTFQSPASCTLDKRSVNEPEVPVERKLRYKNTLLVDRASSPILTLSASPKSQNAFSKPACSIKEPLGYSGDALSPLHSQRKQRSGLQSGIEPHVDNFSQTETDSESSTSRDSKGVRNTSGGFSDKKAAKKFLGKDGSEDVEQQHRYTVGAHTTICAKRLYHSSSMLEVSGHTEVLTGDVRDCNPLARSLRCTYVTGGGRGSLGGIRHENYVGNSDSALIYNYSPPKSDLLFHQKSSATCLSKANINESSEPLVEASSLQFRDFWKNESSCPLLSDMSDVQTSFQDDNTSSVTETECDTEIPLNKNTFVKPYRPRSYSLRDLPIHNKFSNWCGVKGSPPPSLLSLSGSVTDLQSQAETKPGSKQAMEIEGKSQLCDSRSREIERLQRERAQIMSGIHLDLHQHPLSVELTEAKLNYGIGETDALLRVLQSGTADDLMAIPVKQQLYERHMRTIETLRKEREKRLQRYHRSRSLSPQKHFSLLQTLDASHRDLELPSRRREYLQQLRRDVVENTRVQEPKRRSIQHPSEIELMLRDYQRAREETKTEIARARDKLRERAEQEKRRIREQIFSQLQKEEARLKTLASTSTLCTESSLSLSSGPTSGYNSSNTAAYAASKLSSWDGQVSSGNVLLSRDARGRSAVRNSQLYMLEQLQKDSTLEASRIQPPLPSSSISCRFTHGLTISVSSSSTKGYEDLAKHILANATTEVMAACSHNLRNLYMCQAAGGWKYQCTEKEVLVYYKVFPSATKHGFLGAGVIERPLPSVWGLVRDPGKRHLYDRTINTARIHKKVTSHIQLVYLVTDTSLCYLKQPRDFCCITVEAKEENLSVLAIQSVYDASMPHPCKDVVRGEILPSAWILEPDVVNGREITRVIYMAQVDLGAPAIPARLLSSIAKRQPLVIARLAHFLAS
ncbi:stAR-related lipid transfer protein 9 isoform X2 [Anas platyrhynchos]|uniref:stAR-related lipid transfer protein 9 isoform X2 n=1 Tax=Anas platyrhynchos TaxID=8839 RepID=UPI000F7C773F|nr:stAR-related lipid transfer protein 9 isoform X3 [Anas platyrhynchos]|eukprot:XP_027314382.1 stAR-related lipid transfer protein 9 isoform X2 [Anas platyrhynchos]